MRDMRQGIRNGGGPVAAYEGQARDDWEPGSCEAICNEGASSRIPREAKESQKTEQAPGRDRSRCSSRSDRAGALSGGSAILPFPSVSLHCSTELLCPHSPISPDLGRRKEREHTG